MERREFLATGTLAAIATAVAPTSAASAASPPNGWFNVRDFGATGDGSTDDTLAIRAAIDAARSASGGVIRFPAGVYVTSTLMLHGGLTFEGVGWQSILRLKPGTNRPLIETPAAQDNYYGVIRDICLDANREKNTRGDAIRLFAANNYRIDGVKVMNAAGNGIALAGDDRHPTIAPWISNSYIVNCTGNGIDVSGYVGDCKIHAVDIGWCNKGVILPNSSFLSDVSVWQCKTGIHGYWAANSHLHQVRAERCVYSGFRFDGCSDLSIEQCRAYENNQGSREGHGFHFTGTPEHPSTRIAVIGCMSGLSGSTHEKQLYGFTDDGSPHVGHLLVQGCTAIGNQRGGYRISTKKPNVMVGNL